MLSQFYRDACLKSVRAEYDAIEAYYASSKITSFTQALENLQSCRSRAFFLLDIESRKVHIAGNACRLRWCPMCAKSKSYRITRAVENWFEHVKEKKFITLTIKHSNNELINQINHLYKSFLKLRKHKFWKRHCKGGVWFFQIKFCKESQQWHPHIHIVAESNFMFQAVLSDVWLQITKSSKIVDIRAVHDNRKTAEYVARYSARPSALENLSFELQDELIRSLHGKRLCGAWGTAKGIDLTGTKKPDIKTFERISSFTKLNELRNKYQVLQQIFDCWMTNTVLPDTVNLGYVHRLLYPSENDAFETLILDDKELAEYG